MPAQKRKKKEWYPIVAPKIFKEKVLGETYLLDPTKSIGRCLSVSLADLTGDIKRQNIYVRFRITDFTGTKLYTVPVGYEISPTVIKRMVRRRTRKIDDSFIVETLDKKKFRIKPFILTKARVNNSVASTLRLTAREKLTELIKNSNSDKLFEDIVNHKLQSTLYKELNKIYPLKHFEIRKLSLVS